VTSAARSPLLPDVPALGEVLPGFEASIYVGIAAPSDTPAAIVAALNRSVNQALDDAKLKNRIHEFGDTPLAMPSADFAKLVAEETEKWRKVIKTENIRAN
jgi:tripartite-type tricarboxylate transporter receptor subunit TctC